MKLTKEDVAGMREYLNAPMRRMPGGIAVLALKVRGVGAWQQTVNPRLREVELSPYMQALLRSDEVVEECVRQFRGTKR